MTFYLMKAFQLREKCEVFFSLLLFIDLPQTEVSQLDVLLIRRTDIAGYYSLSIIKEDIQVKTDFLKDNWPKDK